MQARRRRNRRPGPQFTDRQNKFRELLVEMTSSFKPIKTKEVYAAFRESSGQDTKTLDSVLLRKVMLSICDNFKGIEYFLQSESPKLVTSFDESPPSETCHSTNSFASEMMPSGTPDRKICFGWECDYFR